MKYIGKYGEHLTMQNLLLRDIESYLAIKSNQDNYDITVILNTSSVKRVQVKSTNLQNENTNNSISGTEKEYDYLVLVILDQERPRSFILTKEEADSERGQSVRFSCSKRGNGNYTVRDRLLRYEDQWEKINSV